MSIKRGGTVMGDALRAEIEADPEYWTCMLSGYHSCAGRLTNEHALYKAGKKIQKKHAIIKLCSSGHGVDQYQDSYLELSKDMREWVALSRSNEEELDELSVATSARQRLKYLESKYGVYMKPPTPNVAPIPQINHFRQPTKKITTEGPLSELDREAKRFARDNGMSFLAAKIYLTSLV